MTYEVPLDGDVFPGLPASIMFLPDQWVLYQEFESKHTLKVWGDPTFILLNQPPMVTLTVLDCDPYLWDCAPEYVNRWSPLSTEEMLSGLGIETIIYQRQMLFETHTVKHNIILTGVAPVLDPSRVWETQDIISSVVR